MKDYMVKEKNIELCYYVSMYMRARVCVNVCIRLCADLKEFHFENVLLKINNKNIFHKLIVTF